jgi:thioredoxin-like negative regulator of GroEL
MAPALEAFAARRSGDLAVVKVDIDAAPTVAASHGVRSVPTLMLFRDGEPVAVQAGMQSEKQLGAFVDRHLPAREKRVVEQDPDRPQIKLDW